MALFFAVKSTPIAPTTQFQCRDYSIPIQLKCDGLVQCVPDGSDEIDCPTKDQSEQALKIISRQIYITIATFMSVCPCVFTASVHYTSSFFTFVVHGLLLQLVYPSKAWIPG